MTCGARRLRRRAAPHPQGPRPHHPAARFTPRSATPSSPHCANATVTCRGPPGGLASIALRCTARCVGTASLCRDGRSEERTYLQLPLRIVVADQPACRRSRPTNAVENTPSRIFPAPDLHGLDPARVRGDRRRPTRRVSLDGLGRDALRRGLPSALDNAEAAVRRESFTW